MPADAGAGIIGQKEKLLDRRQLAKPGHRAAIERQHFRAINAGSVVIVAGAGRILAARPSPVRVGRIDRLGQKHGLGAIEACLQIQFAQHIAALRQNILTALDVVGRNPLLELFRRGDFEERGMPHAPVRIRVQGVEPLPARLGQIADGDVGGAHFRGKIRQPPEFIHAFGRAGDHDSAAPARGPLLLRCGPRFERHTAQRCGNGQHPLREGSSVHLNHLPVLATSSERELPL
jgi:hypothetical protein